ncbi:MAG: hypothetical protein H9847_10245 [Candidatus Anaerobiospirillum pullicola]|uniref:Uncharacterized protein n=1 Tax=Candidatus Anaerobiospirillum pullicola TaxID=2838451 RepID=A0A948THW7_9GAMM|nr:hypothetical protein [Candidatus Anaerobiospirillum pullicola]
MAGNVEYCAAAFAGSGQQLFLAQAQFAQVSPLFLQGATLCVWLEEHQGEEQVAVWTDVAAMKRHLLYLNNLNIAMEMLLGWMLHLFKTQVEWLYTLQGYTQDGTMGQLELVAKRQSKLKSALSSGKAKKVERKKAKQSRVANRKRRK